MINYHNKGYLNILGKPKCYLPVGARTRRGGSCQARACVALCEPVALLLSKNMTCARPRRNATPSEHFLHTCTSHPALHLISSHLIWALITSSHLFAPHLNSSHLIPSLLTCHLSKFFSTVFISSKHWSTFLISSKLASTHLSCFARQEALTVREKSLAQKRHWAQKAFAHRSLRHRCIYAEKPCQNTLYHKACTKHFPVLLCTAITPRFAAPHG